MPYLLKQVIRPNSGLNYQSLDTPLYVSINRLPNRKFKYSHIVRLNDKQLNFKIGDLIKLNKNLWEMSMDGEKRDGFWLGNSPNAPQQLIRFPLYKTVEEYHFYRN